MADYKDDPLWSIPEESEEERREADRREVERQLDELYDDGPDDPEGYTDEEIAEMEREYFDRHPEPPF